MENTIENNTWDIAFCKKCEELNSICPECKKKDDAFCEKMMAEFAEEESRFYLEQKRITDRVLKGILAVKGSYWTETLIEYAKHLEVHNPFAIVRKPKGKIQSCDEGLFVNEWVDQSTGYECDDYYGTISIQIDDKRWLEMPYHL